jgi:four helix bundle protein
MNKPARSFIDLFVWQKSHKLVLLTNEYSSAFPKTEIFGLTSQLRRAITSVPANIAEGFKKKGKND